MSSIPIWISAWFACRSSPARRACVNARSKASIAASKRIAR
jgi:hypothetical protein